VEGQPPTMEQFFLEQLVEDKAYFEKIAQTDMVQVVLKEEAKRRRPSLVTRTKLRVVSRRGRRRTPRAGVSKGRS
jgi:hypothetical protein